MDEKTAILYVFMALQTFLPFFSSTVLFSGPKHDSKLMSFSDLTTI
jgi:hypothetical protein